MEYQNRLHAMWGSSPQSGFISGLNMMSYRGDNQADSPAKPAIYLADIEESFDSRVYL